MGQQMEYPAAEEMLAFYRLFPLDHNCLDFRDLCRNERQRNLLGVADRLIIDRLVPSSWKYIIAGVAVK